MVGNKNSLPLRQTEVYLRYHSLWNLNSIATYPSFESFGMCGIYSRVIDDLRRVVDCGSDSSKTINLVLTASPLST